MGEGSGEEAASHGASTEELRAVLRGLTGPQPEEVSADLIFAEPAASATVGIWRFSAGDWSVILKVLRHGPGGSPNWQSGPEVDHWYYWKREGLAYRSGILSSLAGGLRAPGCYGVFDRPDGSVGIWLEDLRQAQPGADWRLSRYRQAGFDLGQAQGRTTALARSARQPWLGRDWLRRYVERRESFLGFVNSPAWDDPMVRDQLPANTAAEATAVWDDREALLASVEAAPLCLGHNDLHPGNLFADPETTVLIDWGFLGLGHLGEDLGNLIFDAVLDFFVSPADFSGLHEVATEGYLAGVAAAAPDIDIDVVRRAIAATAAVKYFWIPLSMVDAVAHHRRTLNRRPIQEAFAAWSLVVPEIFDLAHRLRVGG